LKKNRIDFKAPLTEGNQGEKMSVYVVWVDREDAKIFRCGPGGEIQSESLLGDGSQFPTSVRPPSKPGASPASTGMGPGEAHHYSGIAGQLKIAAKILILGPGVAKHHFQNFLAEHFPILSKKVVGCETVDQPNEEKIAAISRRFLHGPKPTG
jgi:hypothetical protein